MALASLSLDFSICILGFFSPGPSWNSTAIALTLWVNLETIDVFMALSLSSHELLYISVYSRCLRSAVVFCNVLPEGLTQLVFTATMVLALFVFPNWLLPGTGTLWTISYVRLSCIQESCWTFISFQGFLKLRDFLCQQSSHQQEITVCCSSHPLFATFFSCLIELAMTSSWMLNNGPSAGSSFPWTVMTII